MNPRAGQFGLGGTLRAWTRLDDPTPQQRVLLRRVYRGCEPRTLSRYGVNQWRAPLPWTTTVVKDPFALLSVPTIVRETGAVPVVVYRHPGAVLASFRRVGWTAGTAEVRALQGRPAESDDQGDAAAMGEFWCYMHEQVLSWLDEVPQALVVSHAEVAHAGDHGLAALREALGLGPAVRPVQHRRTPRAAPSDAALHRFDRAPQEVADGWRSRLTADEIASIERRTAPVYDALQARRLVLLR